MSQEMAVQQPQQSHLSVWEDPTKFAHAFGMAKLLAASDLVPKHFQGKVENCFIAMQMGMNMGLDPFTSLRNIYVVHGNPGLSAQLIIAMVNKSNRIVGPISYTTEGNGDTLTVTASAKVRETGEVVSSVINLGQAKRAGWTRMKEGGEKPMWAANPVQMLRYRAATMLVRSYFPELILGMKTDDELYDHSEPIDVTPEQPKSSAVAALVEKATTEKRGRGRPRKEEAEAKEAEIVEEKVGETAENSITEEFIKEEQALAEDTEIDIGF